MKNPGRKQQIRQVAMDSMLRSGYHGFSFQHVADEIGVKKPSLFDHYSSKEELGIGLISEYRSKFSAWTERVAPLTPEKKIIAFFGIFVDFANEGKICPVGTLGVEMQSLPESMSAELRSMLEYQKSWVEKVILDGQKEGTFQKKLPVKFLVETLASLILGAQTLSRLEGDSRPVLDARKAFLNLLLK